MRFSTKAIFMLLAGTAAVLLTSCLPHTYRLYVVTSQYASNTAFEIVAAGKPLEKLPALYMGEISDDYVAVYELKNGKGASGSVAVPDTSIEVRLIKKSQNDLMDVRLYAEVVQDSSTAPWRYDVYMSDGNGGRNTEMFQFQPAD